MRYASQSKRHTRTWHKIDAMRNALLLCLAREEALLLLVGCGHETRILLRLTRGSFLDRHESAVRTREPIIGGYEKLITSGSSISHKNSKGRTDSFDSIRSMEIRVVRTYRQVKIYILY